MKDTGMKEGARRRHARLVVAAGASTALLVLGAAPVTQKEYASAEAAADALVAAVERPEPGALAGVLGADWKEFIPTEGISDDDEKRFLDAWNKSHAIVPDGADKALVAVGENGWTLPIPVTRSAAGWRFDVAAGADEMRTRRIGRNELSAINAVYAYHDAQREYAERDHDGDGELEYAQRIVSTPGEQDGLYWAALEGEDTSPLGPLFGLEEPGTGYHGYRFRILTRQGKDAPGGAYDYLRDGSMSAGFGLIAWPVRYGDTGIMSFMVSHDAVAYEADLGPETDAAARAIQAFAPSSPWSRLGEENQ